MDLTRFPRARPPASRGSEHPDTSPRCSCTPHLPPSISINSVARSFRLLRRSSSAHAVSLFFFLPPPPPPCRIIFHAGNMSNDKALCGRQQNNRLHKHAPSNLATVWIDQGASGWYLCNELRASRLLLAVRHVGPQDVWVVIVPFCVCVFFVFGLFCFLDEHPERWRISSSSFEIKTSTEFQKKSNWFCLELI